jgi:membrane fusion protein, type I secretion system
MIQGSEIVRDLREHAINGYNPRTVQDGAAWARGDKLILELKRIKESLDQEFGAPEIPSRTRSHEPNTSGSAIPGNKTPARVFAADVLAALGKSISRLGLADYAFAALQRRLQARDRAGEAIARRPGNRSDEAEHLLAARMERGFRYELNAGLKVLMIGGGLVIAWSVLAPLSGAVVVQGNLIVESSVRKIQHPTGGVVSDIAVRDGQQVREGAIVVRLDATQAKANLLVVAKQLDEVQSRIARLTAERDGGSMITTPKTMQDRGFEIDLEHRLASEQQLLAARLNSRQTQKELLGQQIEQLQQQIAGLDAQIRAKSIQRDLALTQLQSVQGLYDKRLVPLMRLTTVQGDIARLEGEQGQLVSAIAEARSKISEQKLQIVRIDQDFRADVMKELREAQAKEAELVERSISAKDVFDRVEIRAPTSGVVHQLAAHTIGGVVGPGEVIMEIVPDADTLEVDARLKPTEIDQVRIGQKSRVSFPAFNRQMTPELTGVVSYISADLSHDKQSNATYYTVKVSLPGAELRRLGDLRLVSGMPVEAFLEAGTRTMISYLFKPITDQLRRAFKER